MSPPTEDPTHFDNRLGAPFLRLIRGLNTHLQKQIQETPALEKSWLTTLYGPMVRAIAQNVGDKDRTLLITYLALCDTPQVNLLAFLALPFAAKSAQHFLLRDESETGMTYLVNISQQQGWSRSFQRLSSFREFSQSPALLKLRREIFERYDLQPKLIT